MLIPLVSESSLRKSEVVAYDPFIVSSRAVFGSNYIQGTYDPIALMENTVTFPFTGTLEPWYKTNGSTTFSLDTQTYVSSPSSARIDITTNTNTNFNVGVNIETLILKNESRPSVTPGRKYTLSAQVRMSNANFLPKIAMFFYNSAGTFLQQNVEEIVWTRSANVWYKRSITATAPATAASVRLQVFFAQLAATTTGTVWVDDVVFEPEAASASTTPVTYRLGEEIFDGTYYHEVVANPPYTAPYIASTGIPAWNKDLGGYTTTGTVKFQNIGTSSKIYGQTDDVLLRIGHGSFALVQMSFPQTVTPSVESARLVLTAPMLEMSGTSDVYLAPSIQFDPLPVDVTLNDSVASLTANGTTISSRQGEQLFLRYTSEVDLSAQTNLVGAGDLYVTRTVTIDGVTQQILVSKPEITTLSFGAAGGTEIYANLAKIREAESELSSSSYLATESLLVVLFKRSYEPFDIEAAAYTTAWPPDWLDVSTGISVQIPRFGEQVSIDLTGLIDPERSTYTFAIYRASTVLRANGVLKDIERTPVLLGSDQSQIQPYAHSYRSRRSLEESLGGPYLGYILDTYETESGITAPIPWFDTTEAKRIASRMTETNFLSSDPALEVRVEYNSASQEFIVTQVDFRTIEGVPQNGLKTEIDRIRPIRIGSKLLYSLGTYDVPWLLVRSDYNPNPIIRLNGALPVNLTAGGSFVNANFTKAN